MENIISETEKYIVWLKRYANLDITLHPFGNEFLISNSRLAAFNIHENSYCIYVKSFPEAQNHCIERQNKILEKCKLGSFCGTCYAGVKEYVYPIYGNDKTNGFVCVSGYMNENALPYMKRCSGNYGFPIEHLEKTYSS